MLDRYRIVFMVLIDLCLVNLALYLSFAIRWDNAIPANVFAAYKTFIVWVSIIQLSSFYYFGLYQWSFRYASFIEGLNIIKAVGSSSVILIILEFYFDYRHCIGRSVPIIDFLLCAFFISTFRFFFRVYLHLHYQSIKHSKLPRVLIIGAGRSGESVMRELINAKEPKYFAVGFVDDDPVKKNQIILGLKVLGTTEQVASLVKKYKVNEIIIAFPSASGKIIRNIVNSCQKSNVKFKIIPGLYNILSGKAELKKFRNVEPQDLLERAPIVINNGEINDYLLNKVVLITGAAGSIGSELVRQVAAFKPKKLILVDHNENETFFLENELKKTFPELDYTLGLGDITDVSFIRFMFSKYRPEAVFHAAAHKHVPLMEANPASAIKNNVLGTRNLIYAAEHYGVKRFVMISTDKAVNPTSVMGTTKRITELLLEAKASSSRTKFMAVRFGNVIGSNGSAVQLFKKQIEEGGPITVTHPEIRRFFMTVSEAAQLVLQAGAIGNGGEIFILDMGEQIKIVDLAKHLIILSGLELGQDISIEFTGLRPGEKLYEEVLHNSEHDSATKHNKIFISHSEKVDFKRLKHNIRTLTHLSKQMNNEEIIKLLKEIVPNYTPTPN